MKKLSVAKEEFTELQKDVETLVKIATALQWKQKAQATRTLKLPSDVIVEVKRLNLLEAASCGHIPLELVKQSMSVSEKMASSAGWNDIEQKDLSELINILRKVALLAVVSPIVSENSADGDMDAKDIPMDDLLAIFTFVSTGEEVSARLGKTFRK